MQRNSVKKMKGYQKNGYSIIITLIANACPTQVQQNNFIFSTSGLTRDPEKDKNMKNESVRTIDMYIRRTGHT